MNLQRSFVGKLVFVACATTFTVLTGPARIAYASPTTAPSTAPSDAATHLPLRITGGHDTEDVDRGRPVVLVAAALGVPSAVFREAFTHVHPAGPGEEPQPDQVRENKRALMEKLGPYGVTDDRLNEVSNYYRYRRSAGEMWKNLPADGYSIMRDGKLEIVITSPGAGYSTPPTITVEAMPNIHSDRNIEFRH